MVWGHEVASSRLVSETIDLDETVMKTPIKYISKFAEKENELFDRMWEDFPWVKRGSTPRVEAFFADEKLSYTYGKGAGVRTYESAPWNDVALDLKNRLLNEFSINFDVCFANGYEDQSNHLGWHADDSPEVCNNTPIAIVSFGVAREIWFCRKDNLKEIDKVLLEPGSLCLMLAGMQSTHLHRIPKAGFACGKRISLTYRGLARN